MKNFIYAFIAIGLMFSCKEEAQEATPSEEAVAAEIDLNAFQASLRWLSYSLPGEGLLMMEQNIHNPNPIALIQLNGVWHESTYQMNTYKGYPAYKIALNLDSALYFALWEENLYWVNENLEKESVQLCEALKNNSVFVFSGLLEEQKSGLLRMKICQSEDVFYFNANRNYQFMEQAYQSLKDQGLSPMRVKIEAYINEGKLNIVHMGALRNEEC